VVKDHERRDDAYLVAVEGRRNLLESVIWGIPGLAVASQAFLFTVTLAAGTPTTGRLLAAIAGLVAAGTTIHYMLKNLYHFDLLEAVIDAERDRLGLRMLHRHELIRTLADSNGSLFERRWLRPNGWRRWANEKLVIGRSAVMMWVGTLVIFAVIDVVILVLAVLQALGVDAGLAA